MPGVPRFACVERVASGNHRRDPQKPQTRSRAQPGRLWLSPPEGGGGCPPGGASGEAWVALWRPFSARPTPDAFEPFAFGFEIVAWVA